jgi:PPK2 family polyphosphate:nucleotide phosphotransferase
MKELYARYRVTPGRPFRLSAVDPEETPGVDKATARERLKVDLGRLSTLQERLYAEAGQSLLLILQAMDGGGKDSTIKRVFSGINPQGCYVANFKTPTSEELAHDFLWRVHQRVPSKGYIAVFNRSHYEDVLVARVHSLAPTGLIEARYEHINAFEKLLHDHGTRVVKVFLHISKEYQLERMRRRQKRPDKLWKFAPEDLKELELWDSYMEAYEVALNRCSTPWAPWHVVPANHKWFRSLLVTRLLIETLQLMDPKYPDPAFNREEFPPDRLERC